MPSIDALNKRFAFDGAIKKSLLQNGDRESETHRIDHHFLAGNAQALRDLSGCARALGFEAAAVSEGKDQGQSYWHLDIYSARDTKLPSITREAILMEAMALAFVAAYDGWGTNAVK